MTTHTAGRFAIVAAFAATVVAAPAAAAQTTEQMDALVYLGCMSAVTAATTHAYETLGDALPDDPTDMDDPAWRAAFTAAAGTLSVPAAIIGECEPVPAFDEAHASYVAATDDLADASELLVVGVLTEDGAALSEASDLVESSVGHLEDALDALPYTEGAPASVADGTF